MEKKELLLNEIKCYFKDNKRMPTIRYLQRRLSYKSTNSVYRLLVKLEKEGYLIRNNENKLTITNSLIYYDNGLKRIKIINRKNEFANIILNSNNSYLAYKINNNCFIKDGIVKDDILIIKVNKKISNNDIGLFLIDNKYRIMKYKYQDGFYILKDKEELILSNIDLIGNVILIERQYKNFEA